MLYRNVCLESLTYTLPEEVVTSAQVESALAPLYQRLRLPEGRLELMTGIAARRLWAPGTLPSQKSAATAEKAIALAQFDKRHIGAVVHGSVCRDQLEPATACRVHELLELPEPCILYDVSNACLGLLNGVVQVANMIELGQIRAGIVVGTESSRALLETTIARLNQDTSLTRNDIKSALASLTIGSGSAAMLLVHRELSRTGNRLVGGVARTYTDHCRLCHGGNTGQAGEMLMWTDSEGLMREGIQAAVDTFLPFLNAVGWHHQQIDKTFCHQVGRTHRKLTLEALGLDPAADFATLEFLGNTGSVALPITAAMGIEQGHVGRDDRLALLGIGSGINVLMLGVHWQHSLIEPAAETSAPIPAVLDRVP